jgi:hypothetical protein
MILGHFKTKLTFPVVRIVTPLAIVWVSCKARRALTLHGIHRWLVWLSERNSTKGSVREEACLIAMPSHED